MQLGGVSLPYQSLNVGRLLCRIHQGRKLRLSKRGESFIRIPNLVYRLGNGNRASFRDFFDLLILFFFLFQLLTASTLLLFPVFIQGHLDVVVDQVVGKLFSRSFGRFIFHVFQMVLFGFIRVRLVKSLACRFGVGVSLTGLLSPIASVCQNLVGVVGHLRQFGTVLRPTLNVFFFRSRGFSLAQTLFGAGKVLSKVVFARPIFGLRPPLGRLREGRIRLIVAPTARFLQAARRLTNLIIENALNRVIKLGGLSPLHDIQRLFLNRLGSLRFHRKLRR